MTPPDEAQVRAAVEAGHLCVDTADFRSEDRAWVAVSTLRTLIAAAEAKDKDAEHE